jgi:glycosyltransferase involved in cell wall biosynthesis
MKPAFVSVIVCTYNRAQYLERCLDSLIKQKYPFFEIIVVNGPSNDDTERILNKYKTIKIIQQGVLDGLSSARNLGIKAAKGDIIAFLDDDAIANDAWIKCLIEGYTDILVGGVGGPVFDITGNWYQFRNGYITKEGNPSFNNYFDRDYNSPEGKCFNYLMGTNSSFRKSVYSMII